MRRIYKLKLNINYKSYKEILEYFKLESLELRRLKIYLATIFKISNNYTDIIILISLTFRIIVELEVHN